MGIFGGASQRTTSWQGVGVEMGMWVIQTVAHAKFAFIIILKGALTNNNPNVQTGRRATEDTV